MSEQYVLIQEKSEYNLDKKTSDGKYILEGIFAEFGKKNNNNRIYEEKEYLPHLDYLQKRIDSGNLVGELDHPEKLEPSLTKASHVIEEITYDKNKRQILGKIRLLSTDPGRNAKALLDDGVQLSISSRAVGSVREDKTVEIKKIITYDLVAEPGFENAKLNRINEQLNILDENVNVYEISESQAQFFLNRQENITNQNTYTNNQIKEKNNIEDNMINEELQKRLDKIESYLESFSSELIEKNNMFESKIQEIEEFAQYHSEATKDLEEYTEYHSGKTKQIEEFTEYHSETTQKIEEYLKEFSEESKKLYEYVDYHSKETKLMKEYLESFTDNLKVILEENENYKEIQEKYFDYISENMESFTDYMNLTSGEVNRVVKYSDYISDLLEQSIRYQENIAEEAEGKITTDLQKVKEITNDIKEEVNSSKDIRSLKEKFTETLESVKKKKQEVSESKNIQPYLNLLNEDKKREFMLLDKDQKQMIYNEVMNLRPVTESQFINIWTKVLTPPSENDFRKKLTDSIPNDLKEKWNGLDINSQERIYEESKLWDLRTPEKVLNFWYSRKVLNEEKINTKLYLENSVGLLNESVQNNDAKNEFFNSLGKVLDKYKR